MMRKMTVLYVMQVPDPFSRTVLGKPFQTKQKHRRFQVRIVLVSLDFVTVTKYHKKRSRSKKTQEEITLTTTKN